MLIYVATTSFSALLDGDRVLVNKGDTVREGHALLERFPVNFAPQRVKFEHLPPAKKAAPAPPKK